MSTINTKWFTSAMAGAPSIVGNIGGGLIAALIACLKDGFNLLTLDSLVVASNVATGSKTNHGYLVNQVITIAGASPSSLNGDWRVASVTANTFTFATSGIADQTATGTITAKTGHCGWLVPYTGTNQAVFKSGDVTSTQLPVRVDDSTAQYSTLRSAEGFSDISTEVNGYSTQYVKRSNATDANARPWLIVADSKSVYLGIQWTNAGSYDFVHFGDFASSVAGDAFNYRLQGLSASAPATLGRYSSVNDAATNPLATNSVCPRNYAQMIGAVNLVQHSLCGALSNVNSTAIWKMSGVAGYAANQITNFMSPSVADNGNHFVPVFLIETPAAGQIIRGTARGLLHVIEYNAQASGYSILTGVNNVTGGLVLLARSNGYFETNSIAPATTLAFSLSDW